MDYIDFFNFLLKYIYIYIVTFFLCIKISNFKLLGKRNTLLIIFACIILSIMHAICSIFINPSYIIIISYILLGTLYMYITKYKLDHSLVVTFISLAITHILYEFSILISLLFCILLLHLDSRNTLILFLAILIEVPLIFFIFKIKRFKNGFSFLKDKEHSYDLAIFLSGIVILIIVNLGNYINKPISEYSLIGLGLILISLFLWIRKKISLYYKSLLVKDTIENLQTKLDEQININENMKAEIEKLSKINHKYSSRLSALELYVSRLSNKLAVDENISNNMLESKELIKNLSTEFSNELKINLNNDFRINKTGIINIDNILEYFYLKCRNKNISFNVIVKNNIKDSVNNAISLNLLETLIADMIKNSTIAIGYSSNKNPKILVQFDSTDYFEFRIYDTGIEFEIDTLVNLGKERITTHKEDGGSGIGFVTTFETLRNASGSLIIEEYPSNDDNFNYSKCLIFRFDNKRKYIIRSYRFEEINKRTNNVFEVKSLLLSKM